jgi:late competence protein required for DNA uptake (superfamily II DNA/RNA helicase)
MPMNKDIQQAPSRGLCRCCKQVEIFGRARNKQYCEACLRKKRLTRNRKKMKSMASPSRLKEKDTDLDWLKKMNETLAKAKKQGIKNYAEIQVIERTAVIIQIPSEGHNE